MDGVRNVSIKCQYWKPVRHVYAYYIVICSTAYSRSDFYVREKIAYQQKNIVVIENEIHKFTNLRKSDVENPVKGIDHRLRIRLWIRPDQVRTLMDRPSVISDRSFKNQTERLTVFSKFLCLSYMNPFNPVIKSKSSLLNSLSLYSLSLPIYIYQN